MSRLVKVGKINKFYDLFIVALLLTIVILIFRFMNQNAVIKDFRPQQIPQATPNKWGRNRDFPPDFSEEEKILLTGQLHDYERTTEELDDAYLRFLSLFKTYVSHDPTIRIIRYKGDCFAQPVVLGIKGGQAVTIRNDNDEWASLGVGGESWDVPPHDTLIVYPKLIAEVEKQTFWGYACGELGMAGYFVEKL